MFLARDRSASRVPGRWSVSLDAVPGRQFRSELLALKAATSQNFCGVGFAGNGLIPVASGRLPFAFSPAVSAIMVTLVGAPSAKVRIPPSCHPPAILPTTPELA